MADCEYSFNMAILTVSDWAWITLPSSSRISMVNACIRMPLEPKETRSTNRLTINMIKHNVINQLGKVKATYSHFQGEGSVCIFQGCHWEVTRSVKNWPPQCLK